MDVETLVNVFIIAVFPLFVASLVLYVVRLIKGPTIPDMILAVDCISYDLSLFMALLAIYFRSSFLIVGAISLALWAYALDLYAAKWMEGRELGE
ncbi:MAG: pH regulation protein F [Thermoprotei archaeon]|nr:MAG: pH regulation protein F [Thermoprotei archaeon]RLF17866.1 MAG: pH regulation protein F [Thermoprotei archaeon]